MHKGDISVRIRKLSLLIEYDGTDYHGWQKQKGQKTIQEVVENSLRRITGKDIKTVSAGRTDAGVHALGQVASFATDLSLSCDTIKRALNAILPCDIRILDVKEVDMDFHPRYSAKSKSYIYLINISPKVSPFISRYVCHLKKSPDTGRMKEVFEYLKGTHDFSSFRASGCSARTTTRTIYEISIDELEEFSFLGFTLRDRLLRIRIEGNAFLRHMVRIMVGTILEAGMGKITHHDIPRIINKCDRSLAGITYPAKGLFLEKVYY